MRGEELFKEIYGEKAEGVRKMLRGVHPDFGTPPTPPGAGVHANGGDYHMNSLVYGPVYAYNGILGGAETSLAMIAALVGVDAALQVSWHTDGALRHGATQEEVDAVLAIAKAVVERIAQGRREQ